MILVRADSGGERFEVELLAQHRIPGPSLYPQIGVYAPR